MLDADRKAGATVTSYLRLPPSSAATRPGALGVDGVSDAAGGTPAPGAPDS